MRRFALYDTIIDKSQIVKKGDDAQVKQRSAVLMTEGSIKRQIITFAFPIFLGYLFQQLYNLVDALVVGNFTGKVALAAVTSSSSPIELIVGLIAGVFTGAGVVIARYYGADDPERISKAVHTTAAFALLGGVALTVVGITLSPAILRAIGTPASVLPSSLVYFRIYFSGVLFIALYNCANGVLQAVGDSFHPLIYLIVAALMNIALDFLLVAGFHQGVAGAGIATVISQGFSALLGLIHLCRAVGPFRLVPRKIRLDLPMLKLIMRVGIPSGIQASIISFANTIIQSYINAFGENAVAGCGSYNKISGFAALPIISFSMALTTFISQNLGAARYDRVKKGARFGILAGTLLSEALGILICLLAPWLISLFNRDPRVVAYGVSETRIIMPFFFLVCLTNCFAGILRGAGKTMVPMAVTVVCWCGIRVLYIFLILRAVYDIRCVFWAYPMSWALSTAALVVYFRRTNWMHTSLDEKERPNDT